MNDPAQMPHENDGLPQLFFPGRNKGTLIEGIEKLDYAGEEVHFKP